MVGGEEEPNLKLSSCTAKWEANGVRVPRDPKSFAKRRDKGPMSRRKARHLTNTFSQSAANSDFEESPAAVIISLGAICKGKGLEDKQATVVFKSQLDSETGTADLIQTFH